MIDVCAGSASAALYHLDADPKARTLLIDILPESEMRALIDPAYHSRISFMSDFDVIDLSVSQLQQLVQDAWEHHSLSDLAAAISTRAPEVGHVPEQAPAPPPILSCFGTVL